MQLGDIYSDSKTFVDLKQRQPPAETLQLFDEFMAQTGGKPDRDQVRGGGGVNRAVFTQPEQNEQR